MSRSGLAALLLLLALPLADARAAGHAHIVDDADVETPGVCHLEVWTTNFMSGDGYANAAPACTLKSLPFVELGAGYAHYWGQTLSAPVFGPQIKVRFTDPSSALVLGLGMNGGVNLNTGNFETGSLLALASKSTLALSSPKVREGLRTADGAWLPIRRRSSSLERVPICTTTSNSSPLAPK